MKKKEQMTKKEQKRRAIIEEIQCQLENMETSALLIGNGGAEYLYADAIVGLTDGPKTAVVYDFQKIVKAEMEMNKWDYETALDWVEHNTIRSMPYLADELNPPIIINAIEV